MLRDFAASVAGCVPPIPSHLKENHAAPCVRPPAMEETSVATEAFAVPQIGLRLGLNQDHDQNIFKHLINLFPKVLSELFFKTSMVS